MKKWFRCDNHNSVNLAMAYVSHSVSRIAKDRLDLGGIVGLLRVQIGGFQNLSNQDGRFRGDF